MIFSTNGHGTDSTLKIYRCGRLSTCWAIWSFLYQIMHTCVESHGTEGIELVESWVRTWDEALVLPFRHEFQMSKLIYNMFLKNKDWEDTHLHEILRLE